MEPTLFSFIWKYSKRDQLVLLGVTLTLIPLLFLTLELPKRIINDAIGAPDGMATVLGVAVPQVTFLFILCGIFLLAVLTHGLVKMRINTMKGALSERLLRRFRYGLIARTLRFPAPYFEQTSQGELVSMVTAESEPLGGMMGDAIAQPVLQAGQMLTILGFLFAQSFVFGLAACALIPLQAWLIPMLQRQVNLLNKERIVQVRALAGEIGEGAVGAQTLRLNGGWRYHLGFVSDRLATLYDIRLRIFRKKFFMKFLNNFIGQLTPFFFYAIGGYLTIKGEITIGALVAALAAYKDLSSPWKELLAYYNLQQDLSLRWSMITERFAPEQMLDESLMEGAVDPVPSLAGEIALENVSVRSADGQVILDDLTLRVPAGARIAISAPSARERGALCAVLTREVLPSPGTARIAGQAVAGLHQSVIADRIGHATSAPVTFSGSFGENLAMPLLLPPKAGGARQLCAARFADRNALRDWWAELIEALGSDTAVFRYGLDLPMDAQSAPAPEVVRLRDKVARAVAQAGLADHVWPIDAATYNPALPVLTNLLFATPREPLTVTGLAQQTEFLRLLAELKLEQTLIELSVEILNLIRQIFGADGARHPLFGRLGLSARDFENALAVAPLLGRRKKLSVAQKAQLLIVSFSVSAEVIGPAFPAAISRRVLEMRTSHGPAFQASMAALFTPIDAGEVVVGLSVLENALLGKVSQTAGRSGAELRRIVAQTLRSEGLEGPVLDHILDMPVGRGGEKLPQPIAEALAVSRAAIKRPDVLILDTVMSSHDAQARARIYAGLGRVLPDATILCLEPAMEEIEGFDAHFTMAQGRISGGGEMGHSAPAQQTGRDQADKIQILAASDLFGSLDPRQLRLLAFGADWHAAKAGEYVFYKDDDPSSGAYLVFEGTADLLLPVPGAQDRIVAQVGPGDLIGELALIRNVPRALHLRATTELKSLRIGSEAFMAVVEHDAATAFKLLQVVAGYVEK